MKSRPDITQPWGPPVLMIRTSDSTALIHTRWFLLMRKSSLNLHGIDETASDIKLVLMISGCAKSRAKVYKQ